MKIKNDIVGATRKIFLVGLLSFAILSTSKVKVYAESLTSNKPNTFNKSVYRVYDNDKFVFKNEENNYINNMNNIKKDLLTAFNIKIQTKDVMLNNKSLGVVSTEASLEDILSQVAEKYIEENDLNYNNIKSIQIETNAILDDSNNTVDKIQPNECIVDKLYDELNNKNGVDIKMVKEVDKIIEIVPGTEIVSDEELYYGQSKEVSGEVGEKIVKNEETYFNGEKILETKISEKITKEAKNKIIYKGSRNPYNDGVAFLSHPTRGGVMTSGYGERWNAFHKGIDIAGNIGDSVAAAIDGNVIYAQYNDGGYGNLIMVEHEDNMITYYAHLSHIGVNIGDRVTKGQKIGEVGNTGYSTGPHLHFELRVNNKPVDPSQYIL